MLGWLERHTNNNKVTEVNGWFVDYFKQIFRLTGQKVDGWLVRQMDRYMVEQAYRERWMSGWLEVQIFLCIGGRLVSQTDR